MCRQRAVGHPHIAVILDQAQFRFGPFGLRRCGLPRFRGRSQPRSVPSLVLGASTVTPARTRSAICASSNPRSARISALFSPWRGTIWSSIGPTVSAKCHGRPGIRYFWPELALTVRTALHALDQSLSANSRTVRTCPGHWRRWFVLRSLLSQSSAVPSLEKFVHHGLATQVNAVERSRSIRENYGLAPTVLRRTIHSRLARSSSFIVASWGTLSCSCVIPIPHLTGVTPTITHPGRCSRSWWLYPRGSRFGASFTV
jgi:hypothetical protein